MKKTINLRSLFIATLCSAIGLFTVTSCTETTDFQGNYSVTETPVHPDSAYAQILLSVAQTEEGIKARIAFHHFIKNTFLYSDVTETNVSNTDKDTLTLNFSISADRLSRIKEEQTDRSFSMTVVKQENQNLKLVKTTGNVLPADTSLVLSNVTESDSTFSIGARKPDFVVFQDGAFLYAFWGKVKTIRLNGYLNEYYTFDQNGIPTGSNTYTGFHSQTDADGNTTVSTKYKHDVSGYKTTYIYDKDNRLVKYKWDAYIGQGYGDYSYDQHGRLTMCVDNNGQTRSIIFDKNGKIKYSDSADKGSDPYVNTNLKDLIQDDHGNWVPKDWELEYYE